MWRAPYTNASGVPRGHDERSAAEPQQVVQAGRNCDLLRCCVRPGHEASEPSILPMIQLQASSRALPPPGPGPGPVWGRLHTHPRAVAVQGVTCLQRALHLQLLRRAHRALILIHQSGGAPGSIPSWIIAGSISPLAARVSWHFIV